MKCSIVILVFFILYVFSCKPKSCEDMGKHSQVLINNKSSRTIEFSLLFNYPDTILQDEYYLNNKTRTIVLPHSTSTTPYMNSIMEWNREICWEDEDLGSLWVYFIDYDSLMAIPWDIIRLTNRGVRERREIDLQYLKDYNFTITYEE